MTSSTRTPTALLPTGHGPAPRLVPASAGRGQDGWVTSWPWPCRTCSRTASRRPVPWTGVALQTPTHARTPPETRCCRSSSSGRCRCASHTAGSRDRRCPTTRPAARASAALTTFRTSRNRKSKKSRDAASRRPRAAATPAPPLQSFKEEKGQRTKAHRPTPHPPDADTRTHTTRNPRLPTESPGSWPRRDAHRRSSGSPSPHDPPRSTRGT